jgi:hypothetical protein
MAVSHGADLYSRRWQYREDTLIARFGGDVLMRDLRQKIEQCLRKDAAGAASGAYYLDLRDGRSLSRTRAFVRG